EVCVLYVSDSDLVPVGDQVATDEDSKARFEVHGIAQAWHELGGRRLPCVEDAEEVVDGVEPVLLGVLARIEIVTDVLRRLAVPSKARPRGASGLVLPRIIERDLSGDLERVAVAILRPPEPDVPAIDRLHFGHRIRLPV